MYHSLASRGVIPLYPDRVARRAPNWLGPFAALLARARAARDRLTMPPELIALLCGIGAKCAAFAAPAALLATGVAAFTVLAALVATACGADGIDSAAVGMTTGGWTLLGTTGYALVRHGWKLAVLRWR